jgi:hypothetical protein
MIHPDDNGMITIEMNELERLEVRFPAGFVPEAAGGLAPLSHIPLSMVGYHMVGNEFKPLPIGSTLDREKGIFYWQPGVGFYGTYEFVFIKVEGNHKEKIGLRVTILPKY